MTGADILKLPSRPPDRVIGYGDGPRQFAELRLPPGRGPWAAVAILHGGCWVEYADASYMAHLASALAAEGFATWNVEYRRAHEPGGGWPGTFDDAVAGIDAARRELEASAMVIVGHSAGGQLALYAGLRLKLPAISLAGIVDLRAFAAAGSERCVAGLLRVMGGPPEAVPERYARVSPAELLPLGLPQVLVWGEEDSLAPEPIFADYEARADGVEIVRVPGAGHHDLCAAGGPGWNALVAAASRLTNQKIAVNKNPPETR